MGGFIKKYSNPKYLLKIALLAGLYYGAAVIGQSLSYSPNKITLVWPPAGISLASLLIFGADMWPGVAIGTFLSTITTQPSAFIALGITLGNTLEALSAVYLLRLFSFKNSFERVKDVFVFLISIAVSTLIGAVFGSLSIVLGYSTGLGTLIPTGLKWWAGDFLGVLIVAPAILVWSNVTKIKFNPRYFLETFLLFSAILIIGFAIFTGTFNFKTPLINQAEYLIFPLLIWAAYRFRQKGSTVAIFLLSGICVWGAITGSGPFVVPGNPDATLLSLGLFAAATASTFLVFSTVIDQAEKAESRVLASEERFRSLIENSSDVIVLIDVNGTITYTSPATYNVLQFKPEDLLGSSSFDRVYPKDKQRIMGLFQKLLAKPDDTIEATFRLVRKDNRIIWVDGVGTNLLSDPNVSSIVLNYRDVTERVKLDESKTEFVSLSAHQLRSPVATIRWYIEDLMKMKNLPSHLKTNLDEVHRAVLSMNDAVNLLLNVSRFEMGSVHISKESVDLTKLVGEVISEKERLIKTDKLSTKVLTHGKIPIVIGDSKLIKIILENLLSNSIKYTKNGGAIEISLTPQKDNILFKIKDTGIGIPTKDQPKIFTKLFRGSNVNKVSPGGLGLGLYLIKLVIDLKGGKIWFESEEDKGSTFFVEFPRKVKTPEE